MLLLDKARLIPKSRGPKTILELSVIAFALWIAMPLSVSLFPQKGDIKADLLEEEFRNKTNSKGQVVQRYYYNKGL